jgi:hypothetical protein
MNLRLVLVAVGVACMLTACGKDPASSHDDDDDGGDGTASHVPDSITQLTNGGLNNELPFVSDSCVVWMGARDIHYSRNGRLDTALTSTPNSIEFYSRPSGYRVAWSAGGDVYMYNGSSLTQVTTSSATTDKSPSVSGATLAWESWSGARPHRILVQTGASAVQAVSDTTFYNSGVKVSGTNVVWSGYLADTTASDPTAMNPPAYPEIYFWNGSSTRRLTSDGRAKTPPDISGDSVVWSAGGDIYLFDGDTVTQLTSGADSDTLPVISQGNVAWLVRAGTTCNINYKAAGGTITAVTTSGTVGVAWGVRISGRHLAWVAGAPTQVFFYDAETQVTTQVTTDDADHYAVDISGSRLVWIGGVEVYMAEPSAP